MKPKIKCSTFCKNIYYIHVVKVPKVAPQLHAFTLICLVLWLVWKILLKGWCATKRFLQDLGLLIVKNQLPLQFVKNIWFNIWLNTCVLDLSSLPKSSLLKKYVWWKIYIYVLPKLINYIFTTSFDLWMFKGVHDIFAIVINFLGFDWYPKQVTIGLFEIT